MYQCIFQHIPIFSLFKQKFQKFQNMTVQARSNKVCVLLKKIIIIISAQMIDYTGIWLKREKIQIDTITLMGKINCHCHSLTAHHVSPPVSSANYIASTLINLSTGTTTLDNFEKGQLLQIIFEKAQFLSSYIIIFIITK